MSGGAILPYVTDAAGGGRTIELLEMGTGSAVCAQIGWLSERLDHDRKLANKLNKINQRLDQERERIRHKALTCNLRADPRADPLRETRAASTRKADSEPAVGESLKLVRKPDAGKPPVRFERDVETEVKRLTAPHLDSTRVCSCC